MRVVTRQLLSAFKRRRAADGEEPAKRRKLSRNELRLIHNAHSQVDQEQTQLRYDRGEINSEGGVPPSALCALCLVPCS